MDRAIRHYFNKDIEEKIRLTGGITFETWLLVLSGNQKVVFRTREDYVTSGGRPIIFADILAREKFFYDNVNKSFGRNICPEVYVVDGAREYYDKAFQISQYIEGKSLRACFAEDFDDRKKIDISYKIGQIATQINSIEIDARHPYIIARRTWEDYIANKIYERLIPLVKNNIITIDEINRITDNTRNKKAAKTLSFLHLDLWHCNMIYNNDEIFVLDAENCEFGDPLFELAVIDVGQELSETLIKGYKSVANIDLDSDLYYYYKLERLGLVVDVFINQIINEPSSLYLKLFNEAKERVLI
ncbi:MAG: aminoglycoside phosphotransferase family protein [Oscillospiraceae bacterium]|nr:aminoglycoside phosphotransferase family protein [Oscillospiraceae bacterium]